MAGFMSFGEFLAALAVLAGVVGVAVTARQTVVGELFGIAALSGSAILFDAYFLTWPPSPATTLWVPATLAYTAFACAGLHWVFAQERLKTKPRFEINVGRIHVFNHRYRPVQRDIWFLARVSNSGAPSAVKSWNVAVTFLPGVGFELANGQVLRPWYNEFTGPDTPYGQKDLRTNAAIIGTNGHLEGWIGIGLMNVPRMNPPSRDVQYAGVDRVLLTCLDYNEKQYSITLSPGAAVGGLWSEDDCVIHDVFPPS